MSSLRLCARCSASPREIRRREFLAALSQRSLKISRSDAEDLSRRRRESLQGSLAENAEIAGLVCFCSLALSTRDLPRFVHEFSASLREMLSVSARDPPPRVPRRSLAEIAEDLSQRRRGPLAEAQRTSRGDAENLYKDLSRRT